MPIQATRIVPHSLASEKYKYLHMRHAGLDLLRSISIITGVLFHSSQYLSPYKNKPQLFTSPDRIEYPIFLFFWFFHLFRMELFFTLAGYFSGLTIEKKGMEWFSTSRAKKVITPLFLSYFFIGVPIAITSIFYFNESKYLISISHLWFLFALSGISTLLIYYKFIFDFFCRTNIRKKILFLIFLFLTGYTLEYIGYKHHLHAITFFSWVFKYALFFFIGYCMYKNSFSLKRKSIFLLIGFVFILSSSLISLELMIAKNNDQNLKSISNQIIPHITNNQFLKLAIQSTIQIIPNILWTLNAAFMSILLFIYFKSIKFQDNRVLNFLTERALAIYLLHPVFLIIINIIFNNYNINNYIYFLLLSFTGIVLPSIMYSYTKKYVIFRRLYGA